jgi:DNA invertase Pin-like site-specific DNA recombinase
MNIGYARVSTDEQTTTNQLEQLLNWPTVILILLTKFEEFKQREQMRDAPP